MSEAAHAHDGHDHPAHVAHHFLNNEQQVASGKLGMWAFLATEILMFGGLFCAYFVWRVHYPEAFDIGHQYLNSFWGAFNTVVLIASSFTMAWAVRTAALNKRMPTVILLGLTLLGGLGFMCVKYVEYSEKWDHGLFPGKHFYAPHGMVESHDEGGAAELKLAEGQAASNTPGTALPGAAQVAAETFGANDEPAEAAHAGHDEKSHYPTHTKAEMRAAFPFFSIYFLMTGLHGIHVLVGIGLILWIMIRAYRGEFSAEYNAPVDLVGLYWHLVDLIWIFLFPLLYLI